MARTKKERHIQRAPSFSGYKAHGVNSGRGDKVVISFEEYEAINLCDYELLTQDAASGIMNVSRPTFTRIYESARRKVAKAFAGGYDILFEGGNFEIDKWYRCSKCCITFSIPSGAEFHCPVCGSEKITEV